ncbi:MAG: hypothetical protein ACI9HI_001443 [Salinirussus sp.]|jgi:hypothetical protein
MSRLLWQTAPSRDTDHHTMSEHDDDGRRFLQSRRVRGFLVVAAVMFGSVGAVSFATTPGQPVAVLRTMAVVGGPFVSMVGIGMIFAYLATHAAQLE